MADAISIPSEIKFKEMLSHTFPGFFLAFSLFMLIDYLSPYNLTTWAMSSLTAMISFAGFIFIMGTILGVIIDGIHHSFIEDDVFDNFTAIHKLKMPVERKLKEGNHDIFTRHFFFPKLGDKGAKSIELEDHLDTAYYRYSEFYSNIFISLTAFSIVSPFYIFEFLEIPWRICVSIGIASLLTACICLVSSYTSYKAYLQAQSSVICGFIKDSEKDSVFESASKTIDSHQYDKYRFLLIIIVFLIPALVTYTFLKEFPIWNVICIALIVLTIVLLIDIFYISRIIFQSSSEQSEDESNKEDKPLKNGEKIRSFLEDLSEEYLVAKAKDQIKNINEMIKEKEDLEKEKDKLKNDLKIAKNDLEKAKERLEGAKKRDRLNSALSGLAKKVSILLKKLSEPNLSEYLSKSSSSALLSFISSLLICLIALLLVYTPVNLAVGPTCIKFTEDITNLTSIKEPVETLYLKNLGRDLNTITLIANGIENDWLEISYINNLKIENEGSKAIINSITSGETKFAQVKLNSSTMVNESISQGSYIGSIDIYYDNDSRFNQMIWGDNYEKHPDESIPVYINLTKK